MEIKINGIVEDYVQVVGIMRGTVKKQGVNFGKSYVMLHCVSASKNSDLVGYQTSDPLFFFTEEEDVVQVYGINVGDQICPFYVGTGQYKKLKKIDVIPFKEKVGK